MTVSTGRGSFLNESGEVEMDASVMEGLQLGVGAVAGVRNFLHPARIAFDVMRYTPHALLVGEGAEDFATQRGHVRLAPEELVCERERAVFSSWIAAGRPDAKVFFAAAAESFAGQESHKRGTVGVVVGLRNGDGVWQLYCGTRCACVCACVLFDNDRCFADIHHPSTGGTPGKKKGRVGDVPIVGGGFYADNESVAVSCTGWGEGLMRISLSCNNGACRPAVASRRRSNLAQPDVAFGWQGRYDCSRQAWKYGCCLHYSLYGVRWTSCQHSPIVIDYCNSAKLQHYCAAKNQEYPKP